MVFRPQIGAGRIALSSDTGKLTIGRMASPTRPGTEVEIDEETKRILDERLDSQDEDIKEARPANEVIAELRKKYQPAKPR